MNLCGMVADLYGTVADLYGTVADLYGTVTDLYGTVTDRSLQPMYIKTFAYIAKWLQTFAERLRTFGTVTNIRNGYEPFRFGP